MAVGLCYRHVVKATLPESFRFPHGETRKFKRGGRSELFAGVVSILTNQPTMKKRFVTTLLSTVLWLPGLATAEPVPNFMQRDLDGNGRLTRAEALLSETEFDRYDESKNGELSLGEFADYWKGVSSQASQTDLSYGNLQRQTLDLFLPADLSKPVPLVLWIHGGSWQSGDKAPCPFKNLTEHGIAVASVNYALAPERRFPAQVDDCRQALTWLKAHQSNWGVEFSHSYASGLSAGGHLALLLGAEGGVDGVVSFGAPTDLTQSAAREHFRETLEILLGSPLEHHEKSLQSASPVPSWTSPTPLLLFHGLEDRRIPYLEAIEMARVAYRKGSRVGLYLVPDGSHTVVGGPDGWRRMIEFFNGRAQ